MSEKIPKRQAWAIALISMAGNIAWAVENQYYNVFLYNVIAPVPLYISLMVTVTAFVSTFTTLTMGAVSDVKGKRRVFMIYSFIFWAFTTAMFPFAALLRPLLVAVFIAILFDSVMTYFGATAYDACLQSFVTDITTEENRGKAVGILEIMVLLSTLLIYAASGFIIEAVGYYIFFIFVGVLTGIIGVIGALLAKDSETLAPLDVSVWTQLKKTYSLKVIKENKNLFILLIGVGIWAIGFNVFFSFIIVYLQHHIGLDITMASIVMFVGLATSILLGIPVGIAVDKVGRKKMGIIAIIAEIISLILFALTTNLILLILFGTLWVLFMTAWNIVAQTWSKDLFPLDKIGQFSGYVILFNVLIGMTFGSFIGGYIAELYGTPIVIDGIPGFIPPPMIFIIGAFIMIFSLIPVLLAKEPESRQTQA